MTRVAASLSILRRYDDEMRRDPPQAPGTRIERTGFVIRERGPHNLILSWSFTAAQTAPIVAAEAAFFRALGEDVEWKLYAHDAPANLAEALAAHGFAPDEEETLLALDLTRATFDAVSAAADLEIRRVRDAQELRTYASVTAHAFGREPTSSIESLAARIFGEAPDTLAFVAFVRGEAAAAGRLELPPGRSFAQLWGGGTDAPYRARGVYRRLVAERARIARARGYRYATVDARETSRPILERLGFTALTTVRGWNLVTRPVAESSGDA
jgi:ribosomal protein S18 acetylase RimI-like enzyme